MALAVLYEYPVTPGDFAVWSFVNAAHHRDIIRLIYEQSGDELQEYVLDPFDPRDMAGWLNQHQQMHDAMNASLGIAGYNLLELDWADAGAANVWLTQHAQEHMAAGQILNLG